MKELSEMQSMLAEVRQQVKSLKPVRAMMATSFNADQDLIDALRAAQAEACGTAAAAQQICNEITDIITELEPPG